MPRTQPFQVRASGIHGRGAFATRKIRKGARIIQYTGQIIDEEEASRRYDERPDGRTYLFTIDDKWSIDADVNGNDARFINHSCAPNCRSFQDGRRIFIEALRDIAPGEELAYDYKLTVDGRVTRAEKERFACACGAPNCRGTMLMIPKRRRASSDRKAAASPPANHRRKAPARSR